MSDIDYVRSAWCRCFYVYIYTVLPIADCVRRPLRIVLIVPFVVCVNSACSSVCLHWLLHSGFPVPAAVCAYLGCCTVGFQYLQQCVLTLAVAQWVSVACCGFHEQYRLLILFTMPATDRGYSACCYLCLQCLHLLFFTMPAAYFLLQIVFTVKASPPPLPPLSFVSIHRKRIQETETKQKL